MRRLFSCFVLLGLLVSCGAQLATLAPDELPIITTPTLAGTPTSMERDRLFLANYGLALTSLATSKRISLPDNLTNPMNHWNISLTESQNVGLDFTAYAGQTAELRSYPIGYTQREHSQVFAYLLVYDQQIVGAWMSVEHSIPGIFPINTPLDKLP